MRARQSTDVLVAEADAETRESICAALQRHDLTCDTPPDGAGALECLGVKDYAVVLLDLTAPYEDLFEFLNAPASPRKPAKHKPIVVVMIAFQTRRRPPLMSESIHAVLRKPVDLQDLAELVAGCVRVRRDHLRQSAAGSANA